MRKQLVIITLLVAVVCLSRIPVLSRCLYTHDSVNFALGIEDYNPATHQPHPPGYPVYIGLAKVLHLFARDPNTDLLILSIVFSCAAVVLIYFLGKDLLGQCAGLFAALFLITSPLFWAFGAIPVSYTADVAASLAAAYLWHRVAGGAKGLLFPLTAVIALAAGIRQSLLVFLLPAWAVALVSTRSWRKALKQVLALLGLCICWAIPVLVSSGGLDNYLRVSRELYKSAVAPNLFSPKTPLYALTSALWGLGASVAGMLLFPKWMHGMESKRRRSILVFLSICWGPSVLFSFTVFIANPGYALVFLPCFILMSALAVCGQRRMVRYPLAIGIMAVNSVLFLLTGPLAQEATIAGYAVRPVRDFANFWALDFSRKGIADSKRVEDVLSTLKSHFAPENTLVVVAHGSGTEFYVSPRVASYYLIAFPVVEIRAEPQSVRLPPGINKIVWLIDIENLQANGDGALVESLVRGKGPAYSVFTGGQMRYGKCIVSSAPDRLGSPVRDQTRGPS